SQIILDRSCGDDGGVAFVGTIFVPGQDEDLEQLAQISAEDAETAALSLVEKANVRHTTLETESGFLVYWVSLKDGRQVIVDAGDAAVLSIRSEDGEDDAEDEQEHEDDDESGEGDAADD
ncbi:MAG TPA: hypothetical protein VI688_08600, partial [Anaerolineales bacterium]|nr:hypothetical protein [Anaerolineales bacterium]